MEASVGSSTNRSDNSPTVSDRRMSANQLLQQANADNAANAANVLQHPVGKKAGHTINDVIALDMIDEVAKGSPLKLSPSAQHSKQVRTSQSSSSSQVHKGRSRSSSSASSGKGLLERNSERYKKDRSPSARSRLDKHLEEYSPQDEKRRKARRNSRASTEQAQATTQLPTKSDEGRHRTWSGPEESKGREKGRSIDIEAQSLWSDGTGGSTALNTRGSRTSTSTSKDSRRSPSTFSARMLGGSKSSTADSPRKSPRAISREDAVILVDWDDTLCPTSWVFEQIRRCPDNKALAAVEKSSGPLLDEHSKAVVAFLRAAHACAQVAVVTLATEEFFHQSATTFLENVRVSDLFKELGIEVHFAERPSQMSFPAEIDAKKKAMSQCLSKVYAGRHLTRWNVLSVGDSEIELEALKSLLGSKWRSPLCKTVKFDARPTLTQLTGQLKNITPHLADMMACGKSFHITSHTTWA